MFPRYLTNAYDIGHVVLWISSLLVCPWSSHCGNLSQNIQKKRLTIYCTVYFFQGGPSKQTQAQLTGLFNSITSFFHPSNHGRWLVSSFFVLPLNVCDYPVYNLLWHTIWQVYCIPVNHSLFQRHCELWSTSAFGRLVIFGYGSFQLMSSICTASQWLTHSSLLLASIGCQGLNVECRNNKTRVWDCCNSIKYPHEQAHMPFCLRKPLFPIWNDTGSHVLLLFLELCGTVGQCGNMSQ